MIKILIPVDGSEHALLAVRHALRLVSAGLKARFVVANVQETATLYELMVAHDPAVLEQVN
ncbi:MAG: universal stress protein, partial [Hydrogenophaga sp.]|nr:universal stress protein [Hydrogenophaga sp.]